MVRRFLIPAYGVFAYVLFLASFLYAIGFIGGFLTPTRLDGIPRQPLAWALLINVGLLALFAVQHSGMARPRFKQWLTQWVPEPAERSTYVLLSSVALFVMYGLWQPLGGIVWDVRGEAARAAVFALYATGWVIVLIATFLINHFDLFGLRQVWFAFRGLPYAPLRFATPGPYRYIRHPLYVGWITVFWAAPTMTAAHLLFALGTTAYILAAIRWEERDLIAAHPEYAAYRRRVPKFLPRLRVNQAPATQETARATANNETTTTIPRTPAAHSAR